MDCSEFISRFTEYRDGVLPDREARRLDRHQANCETCRNYGRVVDEGVVVLRSLPPVPVSDDFRPRLQHRIYHVEDEGRLTEASRNSGITTMAAAGLSLLLAAAAWSPVIQYSDAAVELPPVVVTEPAAGSSADSRSVSAASRAEFAGATRGLPARLPSRSWLVSEAARASTVASRPPTGTRSMDRLEGMDVDLHERLEIVDRSTSLLLRYSPLYGPSQSVHLSRNELD